MWIDVTWGAGGSTADGEDGPDAPNVDRRYLGRWRVDCGYYVEPLRDRNGRDRVGRAHAPHLHERYD